jgi:hypothetical protein
MERSDLFSMIGKQQKIAHLIAGHPVVFYYYSHTKEAIIFIPEHNISSTPIKPSYCFNVNEIMDYFIDSTSQPEQQTDTYNHLRYREQSHNHCFNSICFR